MSNLQEIRKSRNMSQAELAAISGVNIRTLQEYEIGQRDINRARVQTVYSLAYALRCRMEDILEWDNMKRSEDSV